MIYSIDCIIEYHKKYEIGMHIPNEQIDELRDDIIETILND